MPAFKDLTDQRFGRLVVVAVAGKTKSGNYIWQCRCDCGNVKDIASTSLNPEGTASCGCYRNDQLRAVCITHGAASACGRKPEYYTWARLIQRCRNPKNPDFPRYGGRGIDVCNRWAHSFAAFLEDMGPRPAVGFSIERIDNNQGYEPGNCRWANRRDQARNTRRNHLLTHQGKTQCIGAWGADLGIKHSTISRRLKHGDSDSEALRPVR